jgi:hypothetical protein
MFLVHQMSVAMFRFMGAIGRTLVIATTFGSTLVLFIVTLSGFVLAYPQVTPWPAWKQFHGHSRLPNQNADRFEVLGLDWPGMGMHGSPSWVLGCTDAH